MADIEMAQCDICKETKQVSREYYHYDVKCDCCNGKNDSHFEIVKYCDKCEPKPPKRISVVLGVIDSSIPKPPEPPLNRILREGVGHFCINCGSTVSKDGFLGLFGEMLCHNKKCTNSKSKKNYR